LAIRPSGTTASRSKTADFGRKWPEVSCKSGISGFKIRVPRRWTSPIAAVRPAVIVFGQEELNIAAPKRVRRNDEIDAREVRLIDSSGDQRGVMSFNDALEIARDEGLDLVEVSPNADPPVCRIMDFGKFLFEQNKKAQSARRKQKQVHVKEIKFRPGTDEGDYQVKLRKLREFLEIGDKTKVTLRFRGREMAHKELGAQLLARVRDDLEELANVEQMPQLEGRQMVMVLAPKKK
jgi:translation initiation factor IF-3